MESMLLLMGNEPKTCLDYRGVSGRLGEGCVDTTNERAYAYTPGVQWFGWSDYHYAENLSAVFLCFLEMW